MSSMKRVLPLALICAGSVLWACSSPNRALPTGSLPTSSPPQEAKAGATAEAPFRLTASIRELMDSEVDPAADFIWASVASISTRAGLEEKQPHTDEEWLE